MTDRPLRFIAKDPADQPKCDTLTENLYVPLWDIDGLAWFLKMCWVLMAEYGFPEGPRSWE